MKKYSLFIKSNSSPVPLLCDCIALEDSILAYHMKSARFDFWIRKGQLKRAIAEHLTITPEMCVIFNETNT